MAGISVFGSGYVGVVSAGCLAGDGHKVIAVDVDSQKIAALNAGRSPIVEAGIDALIADVVAAGRLTATTDAALAVCQTDLSFICVGTPSAPDGSLGLTYVEQVCRDIGKAIAQKGRFHSVVIRSTILPGTTDDFCIPILEEASGLKAGVDFGVGYFPEFLRESTAIKDYYDPGLIVFGYLDDHTSRHLEDINGKLPCEINKVDIRTAEMVKYTSNAWRAVKVTFANEIGNIAKSSGIDGQTVMGILCSDEKVALSSYFMRPGFAFGGSCLPKDVRALRHLARANGTPAYLLESVLQANEAQIDRAEAMISDANSDNVGLIGISFKPGTDDLRESPLISLAARLIKKGKNIRVYDPFVSQAFDENNPGAGRGNADIPDLDQRLTGDIDQLINDSGVLVVGNYYQETVEKLKAASKDRIVVDLTRLNRELVTGGNYEGICW